MGAGSNVWVAPRSIGNATARISPARKIEAQTARRVPLDKRRLATLDGLAVADVIAPVNDRDVAARSARDEVDLPVAHKDEILPGTGLEHVVAGSADDAVVSAAGERPVVTTSCADEIRPVRARKQVGSVGSDEDTSHGRRESGGKSPASRVNRPHDDLDSLFEIRWA